MAQGTGGWMRRILDLDAGVERDHALVIDEKRVDVEFANGPVLHGQDAQLDEAKRKPVQIDRRPVAIPFQQFVDAGRL